jgi:DNA-binding SARP family transcriptional activator
MQFQILGPLRVTDGDEREIALGGVKPATVLAMLLLRPNELVPADRLIEDLWEGEPPPTAAKTLQVHISRLRRALGADPIATARGGYVLEVESDQVDALCFQKLVSEGTGALAEGAHSRASARLRSALGLWRGDALADFTYASFAQDSIARLDGLRIVALESAVEAELALGRHAELIPELKFLVKRHPVSEHLRAQLMLALYRSGRQAEALGIYRAGRRVLVDQLGIEPGEELRELERAILAQDPSLAPPAAPEQPRNERRDKSSRGALVGYEGELGALEDALEDALAGRGSLALVAGEPGVGKSRLADELGTVAQARGAKVLWGRCRSGGGAPAYWPWIQVLRALVADRDPLSVRAELGSAAADLIQLLPELRDLLPDLDAAPSPDAEDARFRLFDAAATFLRRSASKGPLVIVLDDLHAADRSTLALLEFAAPALLGSSVLLVGTYRDTDADLDRPLRDTLTELARTTDCLQLVLTGLSAEDTAHFVEVSAGVAPMPRLAAAVHQTSGGNPLFVSELVRLLRAENRLRELEDLDALVLPRGVEQVIARRLEHLSESCRQSLSLAAVVGREFDVTLLERAGGAAGSELLAQLDDAIAARVVELASGGAFRFSHDLVRQTLYSALGPAEQRRMHGAVGRALEQLHGTRPGPVVSALAHHFAAALPGGDPAAAVRYLRLAGEAAGELAAWHEAAGYYERAAELAREHGFDAGETCDLYVSLAEQLVAIPDLQRAEGAIETADALLAAAPDRAREGRLTIARAHMRMGDALAFDDETIFDAIELFQELGDPAGEARGWGALVILNCGRSDRLKGGEAAERMLECASRAGSRALMSQAMRSMGSNFALGAASVHVAIPRIRALIADAPDAMTKARLINNIARLETIRGRFDEGRALLAEARDVCPPGEWANLEDYLLTNGAQLELAAGNPRRAEELSRASCALLEAHGMVRYLSSEICILVDALIGIGRFEEAEAILERAKPWAALDDVDALMRQARSAARLAFARGDAEEAERLAREALAHIEAADSVDEYAETLLLLAEIRLAAGDHDEATAASAKAVAVAEARGNVVVMQQARELLEAPAALAPAGR